MALRAQVDSQDINVSFTVEISDPCMRAVFQEATPSPIADMVLIRDFDTMKTQTFSVTTDI
jgi:hypothetical protein